MHLDPGIPKTSVLMSSNSTITHFFFGHDYINLADALKAFSMLTFLFSYLIFPFYNHIFKMNQKRDEATAVSQIINHFHYMIKMFYFIITFFFFIGALVYFLFQKLAVFAWVFYGVVSAGLLIVTEVNNFLLGLLAIQRFLLYFVPSSDKYLNISGRTMKWILASCYSIYIPICLFSYYFIIFNETIDENRAYLILIAFLSQTIFLLASTLLYLPIMISIQKLGHLASAQLNKPQRYVLWQLVAVFIGKAISFSLVFLTEDEDYLNAILNTKLIDSFYTPIIIQLTYLGCNRHNLKSLLSSLKPKNFCRVLFCCIQEQVTPEVYQIESTGRN